MKKIIALTLLLAFAAASFGQQSVQKQSSTQDDYLKKSKTQKTIATILLVGGAASLLTGRLIPKGEFEGGFIFTSSYKNDGIKSTLGGIGSLSMLASIPFYIASSKNKRRANAATFSFNNQKVIFPKQNTLVLKTQPTLTLNQRFPH